MSGDFNNFLDAVNKIPPGVTAAFMAVVISILRIFYDQEETKPLRIFLESCICGALSLSVTYAIYALRLDPNWAVFAGGAIGYIGSQTIREIAIKLLKNRAG